MKINTMNVDEFKLNKLDRKVKKVLERAGVTVTKISQNKHKKFKCEYNGKEFTWITGSSPSDGNYGKAQAKQITDNLKSIGHPNPPTIPTAFITNTKDFAAETLHTLDRFFLSEFSNVLNAAMDEGVCIDDNIYMLTADEVGCRIVLEWQTSLFVDQVEIMVYLADADPADFSYSFVAVELAQDLEETPNNFKWCSEYDDAKLSKAFLPEILTLLKLTYSGD